MKLNAFKLEQQQMYERQQQQRFLSSLTADNLQALLHPNNGLRPGKLFIPQPQSSQAHLNVKNVQLLFTVMNSVLKQKEEKLAPPPLPVQQTPIIPVAVAPMIQQQQQSQSPQKQKEQSQQPPASGNLLGLKNLDFLKGIIQKANNTTTQFELTQDFVTRHQIGKEDLDLIYPSNSTQCSNCAQRFFDTPEGQLEKNLHLDWHFRTNKKLKSVSKQINNRAWFLTLSQWVDFKDDEIVGYASTANEEVQVGLSDRLTSSTKLVEEELNKKTVTIPDDSDNEVICGTCRDKLVGVFDDDAGEWIWRNAIRVKGKVYHYSCWVETKGKRDRDRSPERS
ncbi:unnamed protein product [Ambrosiozyma monospora]|uniref:Unnamed protein product n=1 Tax=Ambrosiozyma monospora TaxID=43982 RepID=A0ACB5SY82_AMBMO|nr:unnamed protein product [Ambrosiozyma monospora]